jgi:hypothetical protein
LTRPGTRPFTALVLRLSSLTIALSLGLAGCQSPDAADPGSPDKSPSAPAAPRTAKGGNLGPGPSPAANPTNRTPATVVLPASARVHAVNPGLRFVVLDYTLGGVPPLQSQLSVYRNGEKVGELRLSGPERNGFIAADVTEGFVQVDDEVRLH